MDKGIVRHNIGLDPEFERKLEGPVCRQVVAGPRNQPATRNSRAAFWGSRALRHGRPLSPRLSLTPRDAVQLAATYCDVGHGSAGEQVLEKTVDGGDR